MTEKATKVETFRIEYICDECGKDSMKWNGITLTSNPPQFPHRCPTCGADKTFMAVHYPYIANK